MGRHGDGRKNVVKDEMNMAGSSGAARGPPRLLMAESYISITTPTRITGGTPVIFYNGDAIGS